ncbi:DNA-processing protein DprA [Xinfangfangia sp. CPCC 101601]|uniref:DNA-processing protein DprA n=1 Tax=Pseudogemmobacter lacusdianii TaxID=3069608 RepID=A0ABU0VT59_9RHOB|nr:DNA-processing protein DprA [Xinfangfangia sp. CPCC 101601]MDQ2064917.1 DNA-processing protein DprA [Xinfangfangia sp. CPCC 101601]
MADGFFSTPTHPRPPRSEDERLDWLRLIRSRRVGAVTFHRLLAEHGSARDALAALPELALAAGVKDYRCCPAEVAQAEYAEARIAGAYALCFGDDGYPAALMELPDAPPLLWVQGDIGLLQRPKLALVGARNASSLGLRMATRLAEGLGQAGYAIVSGLARGIDKAAHEAALPTGTIAVQAGGVDVIYPEENAALAQKIREQGVRISEQPMGANPQTRHFPLRNRLIAGLSQAVVVVEAAARSGSLITARNAADQGREVMAVPGHPFDPRAAGCNMLLRDGAALIRNPTDVLEALGQPSPLSPSAQPPEPEIRAALAKKAPPPLPGPVPATRPLSEMSELHSRILARLGPSPLAEDQLIRDLAMPPAHLAPALLLLELEGEILRQPGGLLSRSSAGI